MSVLTSGGTVAGHTGQWEDSLMTPHSRRTVVAPAVAALLLAGAVASCGGDESTGEDPQSAEPGASVAAADICAQVEAVRAAADQVRALDGDSTATEAAIVADALRGAVDDLATELEQAREVDGAALNSAREEVATAVEEIRGTEEISEAVARADDARDQVVAAVDEIRDRLDCDLAT